MGNNFPQEFQRPTHIRFAAARISQATTTTSTDVATNGDFVACIVQRVELVDGVLT